MSRFLFPIQPDAEVSPFWQRLCRLILRLMGWRVERWALPADVKKVVVIGEHHTDNLDSFLMVLFVTALGKRLSWLVKSELDLPIIGGWIRATGGIFVDRHTTRGVVGDVIERFNNSERLFLALAPSGTRSYTDHWKTGFYRMALGANVPIALGYLDYKHKMAGIGQVVIPSGDMAADEPIFQAFYANVHALYPDKASVVKFAPPPDAERKAS